LIAEPDFVPPPPGATEHQFRQAVAARILKKGLDLWFTPDERRNRPMQNVISLARSIVNNKSAKVDAVLGLADLLALMISFLSIEQRYRVADRLRAVADEAERSVDVTAHRSLRTDLGGTT
jgi:hypothetical protein